MPGIRILAAASPTQRKGFALVSQVVGARSIIGGSEEAACLAESPASKSTTMHQLPVFPLW
jgi:hypothetical protein